VTTMKLTCSLSFLLFLVLASTMTARAQSAATITAASCQESDVNAVINGPTHTAVNGDTIVIPAGTCTWTSALSVTANITIEGNGNPNSLPSQFGSGTLNTVIVDNGSGPVIQAEIPYSSGALLRVSTLDIEPASSSTSLFTPVSIAGICSSSGCPNIRVDNIGFGLTTPWTEAGNGAPAAWMIRVDNVFGVLDHNTMPSGSVGTTLVDANLSAYLGVGGYGDNSWAQPDTFGGANVLYLENNLNYSGGLTDCDNNPVGGGIGGCRIAGRFNEVYAPNGTNGPLYVHGLDTDGRPQGGRQMEYYGNTVNCIGASAACQNGTVFFRSGTGYVFGNTLNASDGGYYNNIAGGVVYRTVFTAANGWGACGGSAAFDTNDGTVYYSGTTSTSGTTLTDPSKSWTTNQFIPTGAPYSVYDTTQGWWAEIAANTSDTLTINGSIPEQTNSFNSGDSYEILRATVCADQLGRGAGNYVSGPTPSSASALKQALDPMYEWDDTVSGSVYHGNVGVDTGRIIANRDYYTDNSNGSPQAQTSPTSPFNGTSGVGFGTLANRPTTCTPGVGYFATDQGNWNQSGNGFGQGELFVCTATNTWSLHYTPYTYPHPLTQGTGTTVPPAPTNVNGNVEAAQ